MAEVTNLERGWTLYTNETNTGSGFRETWDLHDPDGERVATFLMQPSIDRLNGYSQGFEAGHRHGVVAGRQQQAKLTSTALRTLIAGDVT